MISNLKCILLFILTNIINVSCTNTISSSVSLNSFSQKIDSVYCLNIVVDSNKNYILSILDNSSKYLSSISGCGNCFIDTSINYIVSKNLSKSNPTIVIEAGVNGSTYGATNLFIIWQEQSWKTWEIYKAPFKQYLLSDINKDGIDEVIEYKSDGDSMIYRFGNGLLIPYK
jgi:hypothetical protein